MTTQNVLIVAGFVTYLLIALALVCAMAFAVLGAFERLIVRRERLVRADERRELGNRLISHSWWFSEDRSTMDLLATAGQDMLRGVDPLSDVDAARERWREMRKKAA